MSWVQNPFGIRAVRIVLDDVLKEAKKNKGWDAKIEKDPLEFWGDMGYDPYTPLLKVTIKIPGGLLRRYRCVVRVRPDRKTKGGVVKQIVIYCSKGLKKSSDFGVFVSALKNLKDNHGLAEKPVKMVPARFPA